MSKNLHFGHVVWADFSYDEAQAVKKRLVMVLADLGEHIVAAYITTNQEIAGINVGQVVDARTAMLVPGRYNVISKRDVYWSASERNGTIARINLAKHHEAKAIVRAIIMIARNEGYGRYSEAVLAVLREAVILADAIREHQEQTCHTNCRPSLRPRNLPPKTANSLRPSAK